MKKWLRCLPVHLMAALLFLDVCSLVLEKAGSAAAGHAFGQELDFYFRLAHVPWAWIGVALGPLQLFVWTKILAKSDLSVAYPVSSLCFPLTMGASALVLHEHISLVALAGAFLITAGVAIVGGDHKEYNKEFNTTRQEEPLPAEAAAGGSRS